MTRLFGPDLDYIWAMRCDNDDRASSRGERVSREGERRKARLAELRERRARAKD